jgi:hypothetical protein
MGFSGEKRTTSFWSCGEIFDRSAVREIHKLSGLNVTEFANALGVPFGTLESLLSSRANEKRPHFQTAKKVAEWRGDLFSYLMSNATRNPGANTCKYSQSRVIRTFFPQLGAKYSLLLQVLHRLQKVLRENPTWGADQLQEYFWSQAVQEKAGKSKGNLFKRFLPWAPELMPHLRSKIDRVLGVHHQPIAWEILAGWLGTTAPIISALINPSQARAIRPIPPEQMRWLILNRRNAGPAAGNGSEGTSRSRRGPGKPPEQEVQRRLPRLKQLRAAKKSWGQIRNTMNAEFGLSLGATAYRNQFERNK